MLSRRVLVDMQGLRVAEVRCPGHGKRWSAPEPVGLFGIVLARRGAFRRRVAGVEILVDSTTGYFQRPGTEQQIAHPAGGDICTSIALPLPVESPPAGAVQVTPRLALAHRLLLARASAGADPVELADLAGEVAAALLTGRPVVGARLVDGVREILATEPASPLPALARRLAVSPWHLSRVFHHGTGTTLRRYRMHLRIATALELLAAGQHGLAEVAASVGFADQAHLTRTLRAAVGQPPSQLRRLLHKNL